MATYLAALRTGKVDYIGPFGATSIRSIDQVESLQRTNPEIVIWPYAARSDQAHGMNVQLKPFDDIRVRKALQMALNLEEINNAFFKGYADVIPQGPTNSSMVQIATPFEQWPEEVKKVFTYDPEGAEALLDEAGLPRGADGIRLKTKSMGHPRYDLSYAELIISYWNKIGIDVEIDIVEGGVFWGRRRDGEFEMITSEAAVRGWSPLGWHLTRFLTGAEWRTCNVSDPDYEAIYEAATAATTIEELNRLCKELNQYVIEKFWLIWGPMAQQFVATQPWLVGFNGERALGYGQYHTIFTRLWIDSELKEAMGH